MKTKIATLFIFCLFNTSFASVSNNMKVNAKITSGCIINGKDYHFGPISSAVNKQENLTIQCSKGTAVRVEATSKNNPGSYRGFYLTLGGVMVPQLGNQPQAINAGLKYSPYVGNFVNGATHTITKMPVNNYIGTNMGGAYDYGLEFKVLSENPVNIPVRMTFDMTNDFKQHIPGDYFDTVYFTVSY